MYLMLNYGSLFYQYLIFQFSYLRELANQALPLSGLRKTSLIIISHGWFNNIYFYKLTFIIVC